MNATVFFQWIGALPPILQAVAVVIAFAVVVVIILLLVDIAPRRGALYTWLRLAMCLLIPLAVMWFFNSYYWAMGVARRSSAHCSSSSTTARATARDT